MHTCVPSHIARDACVIIGVQLELFTASRIARVFPRAGTVSEFVADSADECGAHLLAPSFALAYSFALHEAGEYFAEQWVDGVCRHFERIPRALRLVVRRSLVRRGLTKPLRAKVRALDEFLSRMNDPEAAGRLAMRRVRQLAA
jgi:hypothetical protein